MHYNNGVLIPFIGAICKTLGWGDGQEIPEWMTTLSWFDGDTLQLQTMIFESREALDLALRIICNKHAADATGTQQPCDLLPVFCLLKFIQKHTTAADTVATGLGNAIDELFAHNFLLCWSQS